MDMIPGLCLLAMIGGFVVHLVLLCLARILPHVCKKPESSPIFGEPIKIQFGKRDADTGRLPEFVPYHNVILDARCYGSIKKKHWLNAWCGWGSRAHDLLPAYTLPLPEFKDVITSRAYNLRNYGVEMTGKGDGCGMKPGQAHNSAHCHLIMKKSIRRPKRGDYFTIHGYAGGVIYNDKDESGSINELTRSHNFAEVLDDYDNHDCPVILVNKIVYRLGRLQKLFSIFSFKKEA